MSTRLHSHHSGINALEAPCGLDREEKGNVVIAYEDVPAGQRAVRTLSNVDHKLNLPDSPRIQSVKSAAAEAGLGFFAPGMP